MRDAHAELQNRNSKGLQTLVRKRTKRHKLLNKQSNESEPCRILRKELQRAQQSIAVQYVISCYHNSNAARITHGPPTPRTGGFTRLTQVISTRSRRTQIRNSFMTETGGVMSPILPNPGLESDIDTSVDVESLYHLLLTTL